MKKKKGRGGKRKSRKKESVKLKGKKVTGRSLESELDSQRCFHLWCSCQWRVKEEKDADEIDTACIMKVGI